MNKFFKCVYSWIVRKRPLLGHNSKMSRPAKMSSKWFSWRWKLSGFWASGVSVKSGPEEECECEMKERCCGWHAQVKNSSARSASGCTATKPTCAPTSGSATRASACLAPFAHGPSPGTTPCAATSRGSTRGSSPWKPSNRLSWIILLAHEAADRVAHKGRGARPSAGPMAPRPMRWCSLAAPLKASILLRAFVLPLPVKPTELTWFLSPSMSGEKRKEEPLSGLELWCALEIESNGYQYVLRVSLF